MVSIIIPCYNQGAYIQDAIDSVLAQTYTNWEIIIVDDGSTEVETIQKLKSIEINNVSIYFQKNSGVSVARNFGAVKAIGDYLLFLDGDDKIGNEYLQSAAEAFLANPNLNYVYCDIQEFGNSTNYRSIEMLDLKRTLLHNQTHVSAIIKKELWLASNGFDEEFRKGWEDWDFIIRLLKLGVEYHKIPKGLLHYRILVNSRDTNAVNTHHKFLKNQIYLKHIESYIEYYGEPLNVLRNVEIQQAEIFQLNEKANNIYNTHSYKLGSFFLFPFKFIKKVFFE
jgi:glycosyltransferase involved in cell wall biosynthesis